MFGELVVREFESSGDEKDVKGGVMLPETAGRGPLRNGESLSSKKELLEGTDGDLLW